MLWYSFFKGKYSIKNSQPISLLAKQLLVWRVSWNCKAQASSRRVKVMCHHAVCRDWFLTAQMPQILSLYNFRSVLCVEVSPFQAVFKINLISTLILLFFYNYQVSVLSCTALVLIYSIPANYKLYLWMLCLPVWQTCMKSKIFSQQHRQGLDAFSRPGHACCVPPWMLKLLGAAAEVFIFPPWPWNKPESVACRNIMYIIENIYINIIYR